MRKCVPKYFNSNKQIKLFLSERVSEIFIIDDQFYVSHVGQNPSKKNWNIENELKFIGFKHLLFE